MALQKLFLTETAHQAQVGNSMSTTYSFDTEREKLTVFWRGQKVCERKAKMGDAFVVKCFGSEPTVSKMKLPHRNSDLIMWLLSFPKDCRAYSQEEFDQLFFEQRDIYDWSNYREWQVKGEKFEFILCNRPDCGGVHHMEAFVSDDITKEDVLEMLRKYKAIRGIYYPESFVKKVLQDRFGISEEEVDEQNIFF